MKNPVEIERDPDMLAIMIQPGRARDICTTLCQGSNVVVLSPDVAEIFPDSESVNHACGCWWRLRAKASARRLLSKERGSWHAARRVSRGFRVFAGYPRGIPMAKLGSAGNRRPSVTNAGWKLYR